MRENELVSVAKCHLALVVGALCWPTGEMAKFMPSLNREVVTKQILLACRQITNKCLESQETSLEKHPCGQLFYLDECFSHHFWIVQVAIKMLSRRIICVWCGNAFCIVLSRCHKTPPLMATPVFRVGISFLIHCCLANFSGIFFRLGIVLSSDVVSHYRPEYQRILGLKVSFWILV